jgi:hypothetical protein
VSARALANWLLFIGAVIWGGMEYGTGYESGGSVLVVGCLVGGIGIHVFRWLS